MEEGGNPSILPPYPLQTTHSDGSREFNSDEPGGPAMAIKFTSKLDVYPPTHSGWFLKVQQVERESNSDRPKRGVSSIKIYS